MPPRRSAGLLLFRLTQNGSSGAAGPDGAEVLLGHMGGPLWSRRDEAAWSIPKGEYDAAEEPLAAARREFEEELGIPAPSATSAELIDLGAVTMSSGKVVTTWALQSDLDLSRFVPGTFTMEWPRGSGRVTEFPELDRVEWFTLERARAKLVAGQRPFLDRLSERLAERPALS